jgi:hypothetical protein
MAKELGPSGVHVAHVVIDGPMDGAFVRSLLPQQTLHQVCFNNTLKPYMYLFLPQLDARSLPSSSHNSTPALCPDNTMQLIWYSRT